MDTDKKKIGLLIGLLVAAGVVYYVTSGEATDTQNLKKTSQWLLCVNPKCNAAFEKTLEDVREESETMGAMGGGYLCPECGKKSAQLAEKCPYCGNVFIPRPRPGDFRDRCPKCGKSSMEERRKLNGTSPVSNK